MQTARRSRHKLTFLCAAAMDEKDAKDQNQEQEQNHSQRISLKMDASLRPRIIYDYPLPKVGVVDE